MAGGGGGNSNQGRQPVSRVGWSKVTLPAYTSSLQVNMKRPQNSKKTLPGKRSFILVPALPQARPPVLCMMANVPQVMTALKMCR